MKDYLKEAWYGAFWGLIIGGIGVAILWTVGSIVMSIVR